MHVRLNSQPFEEVDSFKYQASQLAANGGCERDVVHTMDRTWRALESFCTIENWE